jgi:hypothetical protein
MAIDGQFTVKHHPVGTFWLVDPPHSVLILQRVEAFEAGRQRPHPTESKTLRHPA